MFSVVVVLIGVSVVVICVVMVFDCVCDDFLIKIQHAASCDFSFVYE